MLTRLLNYLKRKLYRAITMSEYTPKNEWHPAIRQFDINEIVEGGELGLDNIPHQQLADNQHFIANRILRLEGFMDSISAITPDVELPPDGDLPNAGGDTVPVGPSVGEWFIDNDSFTPSKAFAVLPWQWDPKATVENSAARTTGSFSVTHSSGQKITDIEVAVRHVSANGDPAKPADSIKNLKTDDTGKGLLKYRFGYFVWSSSLNKYRTALRISDFPILEITITSPTTEPQTFRHYIWDGTPYPSASGGNANQTE